MSIQEEILREIQQIPPLSHSVSLLMKLMNDMNHNVRQVTNIVECDSALTAQVLKVVNSATIAFKAADNVHCQGYFILG